MQRLLNSLKQMTQGRERPVLELAFAKGLLTLIAAERVSIYKLEEIAGKNQIWLSVEAGTARTRLYDDGVSVPDDLLPVEQFPLIHACIETGMMQFGDNETVFPVMTSFSRCFGFIEIVGKRLDRDQSSMTADFLAIFINLLALLDYSEIDTLTGLLNRKTFDEYLSRILSSLFEGDEKRKGIPGKPRRRRSPPPGQEHWLAAIDIDHFKKVNDSFGHSIGDEVLLLIATMMKSCFRAHDKLFRFGGEEFVVLLKPTAEKEALGAFERLRKSIENRKFPLVGHVTVSIGVARIRPDDQPSAIFDRADQALYWVKANGRNQTINFETLLASGALIEKLDKPNMEFF